MTATTRFSARGFSLAGIFLVAAALAGCAADGGLMDTASITPAAQTTASADPQCGTLAAQIEQLRGEGTIGRLEKVSEGKGSTAVVKRNALQQQAQLNKANADYIAKCGTTPIRSASAAPAISAAAQPGASGVTVAAQAAPAAAPKQ